MKYRHKNTDVFIEEQGRCKIRLLQTSKLYKLSKIRSNEGTIKAITNCSYFTSSYVLGRNQGDMFNNTHDQSGFYDIVFLKDGSYHVGQFKAWEWCDADEVLAGFSLATILVQNGEDCAFYSEAICGASKLSKKDPQTAIAVLKTGEVLLIVSDGRTSANAGLSGYELREFIQSKYDVEFMGQVDGGGSSEMVVDGKIVNKPSDGTERGMFNGLAFIEFDEVESEPEEEIQETEQNVQKDEQNIQGSETTMKGIDISKWQGDIDLKTLKAKNKLDFVIIRAGYAQTVDPKAVRNMDLCESLGIPYGVYWYSYATSTESALKEAQACEKAISGRKPLFPIFYDIEDKALPSGSKLRDIVKLFCEYFEGRGYYAGVYASKSWFEDKNRLNHADIDKFDKWVAQWADKCTYSKPFGIWQYSSTGRMTGYSDVLDLNEARRDYPSIIKSKGLNGWGKVEQPKEPSCNCDEVKKENAELKAENAELKNQLSIWQTLIEKIKGLLK